MRYRTPRRLAGLVALAAASLASPAFATGIHARLQTANPIVNPNDEFDVELYVFQADDPFNAFDASIRFDPTRLTFVPAANVATQRGALMTGACFNSFHLFNVGPDSLKITLSLLCNGVSVTGPGVAYKVRFKAGTTTGMTRLTLGPYTQFYNAGFNVDPLDAQELQLCITNCATGVDGPEDAAAFAMHAPSPNPWSGAGPASFAFDLPRGGAVRLTLHDVSGRVVATRDGGWFDAGRHTITLERPDVRAGLYFARLQSPLGTASRAVVLTR